MLAVDRKTNADSGIEYAVTELKPLSCHIHGLLLAAIGAVANQSFANNIGSHINLFVAIGKGLGIFGDRRGSGIAGLKIKSAERNQRREGQSESDLR